MILVGTLIGLEVLSRKYAINTELSLRIGLLFFVILFFWYSQVTEVPFKAGVNVIELTISNLNKLFLEESRAGNTQALIGKDIGKKGIPHKVQFILTWLIIFLIFIGAINLII
jgi:uncharacterized membrane protein